MLNRKSTTICFCAFVFCSVLLAEQSFDSNDCSGIFQISPDNTESGQSVCNFAENCTSCCSYGQVCCGLNPCCNGTCCNGQCCDINVGTCQTLASGTDTCVPYGYIVCTNDICGADCEVHGQIPPTCEGFTCCSDSSTICCPNDHYCCGDICCPAGSQYCGNNMYCDAGSSCCGDGCCPNNNTCCIDTCILGDQPCCGTYYCDSNYYCCGSTCCPPGSDYCGSNRYCSAGTHCCGSGCCDSDKDCGGFEWCWFGAEPSRPLFAEEKEPYTLTAYHDRTSCKKENTRIVAETKDIEATLHKTPNKNQHNNLSVPKKTASNHKYEFNRNSKPAHLIKDYPVKSDLFKCLLLKNVSVDPCEGFSCFKTVTDCTDPSGYVQYFGEGILCNENANAHTLLDANGIPWWNCSRICVTSYVQSNLTGNQIPCCNALDQYGLDVINVDCLMTQCNFCSVGNANYEALETIFQGNHQNPYWQQILDFYNYCNSPH